MRITKEKIKHYLKEIFYFIIVMAIVANLMSLYRSQSLSNEPLKIQTFKLINNTDYTIDTKRPTIIHFWATWCPTCKMEASNINFLSKYYQIITIAVKSESDYELKQYLDTHNYHFLVVNDKDGSLSQKFKIAGYPTTFVYNQEGTLVFKEVGYTSTLGLWLRILWAGNK